ncbi:TPA: hypothetical protein ACH3X1_013882 [Trebouxia sp. C0004]
MNQGALAAFAADLAKTCTTCYPTCCSPGYMTRYRVPAAAFTGQVATAALLRPVVKRKPKLVAVACARFERLPAAQLPPLWLVYSNHPSDSGAVHSPVKSRWLVDVNVRREMAEIAVLAEQGRVALVEGDMASLADLMNRNFDLRRSIFGDDALGATNLHMISLARSVGGESGYIHIHFASHLFVLLSPVMPSSEAIANQLFPSKPPSAEECDDRACNLKVQAASILPHVKPSATCVCSSGQVHWERRGYCSVLPSGHFPSTEAPGLVPEGRLRHGQSHCVDRVRDVDPDQLLTLCDACSHVYT